MARCRVDLCRSSLSVRGSPKRTPLWACRVGRGKPVQQRCGCTGSRSGSGGAWERGCRQPVRLCGQVCRYWSWGVGVAVEQKVQTITNRELDRLIVVLVGSVFRGSIRGWFVTLACGSVWQVRLFGAAPVGLSAVFSHPFWRVRCPRLWCSCSGVSFGS